MGSWKLAAVALTRSGLKESLNYGRMTQGCRLLCRLVCLNCCFQQQLLSPTSSTAIDYCMFFALASTPGTPFSGADGGGGGLPPFLQGLPLEIFNAAHFFNAFPSFYKFRLRPPPPQIFFLDLPMLFNLSEG